MANMTYTFGDQLDLLSILLGDPNDSTEDMFPSAIRKMYINRGEIHFANDSKCLRGYATDIVASKVISLPSNWMKNHVLVLNGYDISKLEVALQDYDRYLNSGDYHWYQWPDSGSDKINFLSSVADGLTYKLWYFMRPTTKLDATSDVSIIPIEYREASVYWAAAELLKQIGKTDLANQALVVYVAYVSSADEDMKKKYMDRVNPNVDTGVDLGSGQSEVDIQGRGYRY